MPDLAAKLLSSRRLAIVSLLSPIWLVLGALVAVPLIGLFLLSFAPAGSSAVPSLGELWEQVRSGAALENHRRTYTGRSLAIAWRSVWVAVVTTVLCALIAYPAAYYIAVRASRRMKGALLLLAIVPFWTSFLIRTYAWRGILERQGPINDVLLWLRVVDEPLSLLFTEFAVLIGLVYGELPFMILPLYAALEKLDRSLLEASRDLGAGAWGTFWRVTFPLGMPGLVAGAVLVFVPSIGQFVVSDMLGGGQHYLLGNQVQSLFMGSGGRRNPPAGAAVSVQMTLMVLLMLWTYARWSRRRGTEVLL